MLTATTNTAHRENPYTPDIAPAVNRRRLVSCARVGINICKVESMSERTDPKARKENVRHALDHTP